MATVKTAPYNAFENRMTEDVGTALFQSTGSANQTLHSLTPRKLWDNMMAGYSG